MHFLKMFNSINYEIVCKNNEKSFENECILPRPKSDINENRMSNTKCFKFKKEEKQESFQNIQTSWIVDVVLPLRICENSALQKSINFCYVYVNTL